MRCPCWRPRRRISCWREAGVGMTKESRYNLIFLAMLLAVLAPGAVILFRKKLEPVARAGDLGHVWVLIWDGGLDKPDTRWTAGAVGETEPVSLVKTWSTALPGLVRDELGENAMLMPPKGLTLIELSIPHPPMGAWTI